MLLTRQLHQLHHYVTNIINPHTHDGWHAVTSLSASLQHMTSAANDRLFQIALNQKWLLEFKHYSKFFSLITAKWHKKKSCETRPACTCHYFWFFCELKYFQTHLKYSFISFVILILFLPQYM
jgi:hypothetical protein